MTTEFARYCPGCGAPCASTLKFCTACGKALAPTDFVAKADPIHSDTVSEAGRSDERKVPPVALILAALIVFAALFSAWRYIRRESSEAAIATELSDAERIAAYNDEFLSEPLSQVASGTAMVRNYPTTMGSDVVAQLTPGESLDGRWVKGIDPATRWLKTSRGYVWDGNLVTPGAREDATANGLTRCSQMGSSSEGLIGVDNFTTVSLTMVTLNNVDGGSRADDAAATLLYRCPQGVALTGRMMWANGKSWFKVGDAYFPSESLYEPDYHEGGD